MKRILTLAVMLSVLSFLAGTVGAKDLKIGYIEAEKILSECQEYKDAEKQLKEEEQEYTRQARQMEMDIKNLEDEIDAQSLMWSDEKKQEKKQQYQQLVLNYQRFLKETESKMYQRNLEMSKPIIDKINDIINKIGEEGGYDIIFDASAGNIVFAKPEFDLTELVIEEMKKK